jgi:hypothetical protein
MSDTPRPDLDALRKADKALLAQADRHAEVTGALMDKIAELEAELVTAKEELSEEHQLLLITRKAMEHRAVGANRILIFPVRVHMRGRGRPLPREADDRPPMNAMLAALTDFLASRTTARGAPETPR